MIRLMGQLKQYGNKRYLNATHLRHVKDPHEDLFHAMEAAAVTLMMERGSVSTFGPCAHTFASDDLLAGRTKCTSDLHSCTPLSSFCIHRTDRADSIQ